MIAAEITMDNPDNYRDQITVEHDTADPILNACSELDGKSYSKDFFYL